MTKQEFQEYYQKNKTVVIGVPIIVLILLMDFFVLKPARVKKALERSGGNKATTAQIAAPAPAGAVATTAPGQAKAPIKLPDPIRPPIYPKLSEKIISRFQLTKNYPYGFGERNIFRTGKEKIIEIIPQDVEDEIETFVERPKISYHGFFSVGADKIAILKTSDQLLLTKVGSMMKSSPFRLSSVFPDYVVLNDISEIGREFEVALSANSSQGGGTK